MTGSPLNVILRLGYAISEAAEPKIRRKSLVRELPSLFAAIAVIVFIGVSPNDRGSFRSPCNSEVSAVSVAPYASQASARLACCFAAHSAIMDLARGILGKLFQNVTVG